MTEAIPDYVLNVTPEGIHKPLPPDPQIEQLSQETLRGLRSKFYGHILQNLTRLLRGSFIPTGDLSQDEEQLKTWGEQHPFISELAEFLAGVEDGDLNDLGTWANTVLRTFRPVPKVTGGALGDENPNFVYAPDFRAASTIVAGQNWVWSNEAGFDSLGVAKVTAAGYLSELLSNEIPVTGGQTVLRVSVMVKGEGLTYTGTNPIAMGISRYMDRNEVGSEDLVVLASPTTSLGWTEMVDTLYEVPADCDEVRLRLKIAPNLVAGTVYWDEAGVYGVGMGLVDQIVRGLENIDTPGWNYVDLLLSMFNQFRTTTDVAARVTYLESLQSTGNKINDEFLRVGSTLGANWHQTYTGAGAGTWETDGDYAFLNKSGFGDREVLCRYIGSPATTSTDNQKIIAVLGSRGQDILGLFPSAVDLYGRMDTGETNWIRARFSSNGVVTLTRNLAGVLVDIASTTVDPVSAGATIALVCGTSSGPRFFQAIVNGVIILGDDVSPVSDSTSNFGASYRGYGHGAKWTGSLLILGQSSPTKLNAWAAVDN